MNSPPQKNTPQDLERLLLRDAHQSKLSKMEETLQKLPPVKRRLSLQTLFLLGQPGPKLIIEWNASLICKSPSCNGHIREAQLTHPPPSHFVRSLLAYLRAKFFQLFNQYVALDTLARVTHMVAISGVN